MTQVKQNNATAISQLFWRDFYSLISRTTFWLILSLWFFLCAFLFFAYLDDFLTIQAELRAKNSQLGVTDVVIIPYIKTLGLLAMLLLVSLCSRSYYYELFTPFGTFFRALHLPTYQIIGVKCVQLLMMIGILVFAIALPIVISGIFYTYEVKRVIGALCALAALMWIAGLLTQWLSQVFSHSILVVLGAMSYLAVADLAVKLLTGPNWLLPVLSFFSPISQFNQITSGLLLLSHWVFFVSFSTVMCCLMHRGYQNRYLYS